MPSEYADEATFDEAIRHERFIEFFAEGRRFYDVRRWGTLEAEEEIPVSGMNVDTDQHDFFQRTNVNHYDNRNRVCHKKMVFLPLELNEIKKSNLLDQNPGW